MLDELLPYLDVPKTNDFVSRLESRKTAAALAAEAELSLVWAISKVAHLTVDPELPNSFSRPDALSSDLFASGPAVIEIRAMSDDSFSGKEDMDRTANIIAGYADHLRRGAGKHLYFEFMERSYWTDRYHRERCIDRSFALTPAIKAYLREWITAEDWPAPQQIRIAEGKTDVVISWRSSTSPNFRTHCSMPPVAYDLEDNPIYRALKKKLSRSRERSRVP